MFAMTTIPVAINVGVHRRRPAQARRLEQRFTPFSNGLFTLILVIMIASQWPTLMARLSSLALLLCF